MGPSRWAAALASRIAGEAEAALRRALEEENHLTLAQCRDRLAKEAGVRVHLTTVHRALGRMGWSRKKRSLRAAERDHKDVVAARRAWRTDEDASGGIAPERLVSLDECGVLTNMTRLYGRAPRGKRAYGTAPAGHRERLTVLGALSPSGIVAAMAVQAATSGAVFAAYLDRVLLPELRRTKPDAVPVMDNLAAHKTARVREVLDASGFTHRYLPPYSPDLNPIEPAWSEVKGELRRVAARTPDALHKTLGPALDAVTPQNAAGFFRHAGYGRLD